MVTGLATPDMMPNPVSVSLPASELSCCLPSSGVLLGCDCDWGARGPTASSEHTELDSQRFGLAPRRTERFFLAGHAHLQLGRSPSTLRLTAPTPPGLPPPGTTPKDSSGSVQGVRWLDQWRNPNLIPWRRSIEHHCRAFHWVIDSF